MSLEQDGTYGSGCCQLDEEREPLHVLVYGPATGVGEEVSRALRGRSMVVHQVAVAAEALAFVDKCRLDGMVFCPEIAPGSVQPMLLKVRRSTVNAGIPIAVLAPQEQIEALCAGAAAKDVQWLCTPLAAGALTDFLNDFQPMMLTERRKFQRAALRVPVVVCPDGGYPVRAESINVSASGILLRHEADVGMREHVRLTFAMNESEPQFFALQGRVVRVGPDAIGVAFHNLELAQAERLRSLVARVASCAA